MMTCGTVRTSSDRWKPVDDAAHLIDFAIGTDQFTWSVYLAAINSRDTAAEQHSGVSKCLYATYATWIMSGY